MANLKLIFTVVLLVALAAPQTEADVACSYVIGKLSGCIPYLRGEVRAPTITCCSGVSSLNDAARSTPDRQSVCECLKKTARSIPRISYPLAGGLPGRCGVSIPYKISPSTDCKSVK